MEAARQAEYYTIDDIDALPEGQRAELIDGQIYMMATPSMIHQRIVMAHLIGLLRLCLQAAVQWIFIKNY